MGLIPQLRLPLLATGGIAVALAVLRGVAPSTAHAERAVGSETIEITEATNIAVCVSPDRRRLVLGMHGALWGLPIQGGRAVPLTAPLLDPARPDWAPRGGRVAFEAYSGGGFHIWTMRSDGSDVRQLTFGHGDDREPRFSPDGTEIAFSSDRGFDGRYDVWTADVATGALTRMTSGPEDNYEPAWSPDGSEIAYVSGIGWYGSSIHALSRSGGSGHMIARAPPTVRLDSPSWSPDGRSVAYVQSQGNESRLVISGRVLGARDDVFPFPATWLNEHEVLYTANGAICISDLDSGATHDVPFVAAISLHRPPYARKHYEFDDGPRPVKGIVSPSLSPDGRHIVFEALNQLWLLDLRSGNPRRLTGDGYYKEDPAWSPDGRRIAYSSDQGGVESIHILDLARGTDRRLTASADSAEVGAAWAPDGKAIAYQDQTGATYVADVSTGTARQVIPTQFEPSKASWSASGRAISIAVLTPYTRRFREGTNQILTVDLATGANTRAAPAPYKSISTRGEDGPVYSPDGKQMAFVMDGTLWLRRVDASGVPVGAARQVTREASDCPTWSGDSQRILYLSNGVLRIVDVQNARIQTVPLSLTWHPDRPTSEVLIHAGRMWDGCGATERTDVDILIVGDRIRSIRPHDANAAASRNALYTRFIDASALTVIPGLWESHTHHWISGRYYGDRLGRLWLAYGVTSLHSQGDPAYRAIEARESFASAARMGPRFFATGEPLDGERIYYGFMRPTTSAGQMALELSRARALGYDSLKTYVRLPLELQRTAMEFAHRNMGVPATSHALLPGMSFGMDGMTHIAATSRYGFRYTRSPAGVSYQATTTLLGTSGMFAISTPFSSCALYADDPAMVDDRRLRALNPAWEQRALEEKRNRIVDANEDMLLDELRKEEVVVRSVLRSGGKILAGSDSPLDNVATSLHLNLRAQVKYGLQPWEALQTATKLPAIAFGVEQDLGTIEPGKLADLTFLSGDPLQDIRAAASVEDVMVNGRFYGMQELLARFERRGLFPEGTHHALESSLEGGHPPRAVGLESQRLSLTLATTMRFPAAALVLLGPECFGATSRLLESNSLRAAAARSRDGRLR